MRYPAFRLLLFICIACVPGYWLYLGAIFGLGPDPGKVLVDNFGQGALVLLLSSLAMTPLQKMTGWPGWVACRRQLGLWSFAYAVLHLLAYLYFLLGLDFASFGADLADRPYIAVGAVGLLGLLTLAMTSTRWSMRKLGKGWKKLHRIVYPTLIVVLLHMLWVVRSDTERWSLYATVAVILMAMRLPAVQKRLVLLQAERGGPAFLKKTKNNH